MGFTLDLIVVLLLAVQPVVTQRCGEKVKPFLTQAQIDNIKKQLKIDEGFSNTIYKDSEGFPTFGIGHLITRADPEWGKPVGTKVSKRRIRQAFEKDFGIARQSVLKVFPNVAIYPGEVKEILLNMMFNLGEPRFKGFVKFIAAVKKEDWGTAADEMVDSKWFRQTKDRAKRLVARMRALDD